MTSTVNELGRLELPPEVTAQLGLKPGDCVIVETDNGQCVLRPVRNDTGLRWEGNVLVHQGIGADTSVQELRDEFLNRLGE
ncbi:MAG TPA: AbrB/MazE/SpoVT family DNA-binding domain-containing protein [Gemmata sp.]|jgi:AbrB family looped-hinge helix DNA binding protein|nr:AbrB/MazE/SpoVT family DNA-binding domain-containing protein [Gemmata sp.]